MTSGIKTSRLCLVSVALACLALIAAPAHAQSSDAKIRDNKAELAKIRKEREALEKRMRSLQVNSRNMSEKLENISRQHNATKRAVNSLNKQLTDINDAVKETSAKLAAAEQEAIEKRSILKNRLIDIYKRGPLFDVEVLLSAKSFGALIARYRYLHDIATRDRALVKRVETLRTTISNRRSELVSLQSDLNNSKAEKVKEETRLRSLEQKQQKDLKKVQADAKKAKSRLQQLAKAEARVNSLIARLEAERRKGGAKASAASRTPSSIKTSDYGKLAWPVDGNIIYSFGRVQNPNGTTIRWNGIGIAASAGTAVKAVSSGEVRVAESMGGYGKTVIIEHGGGDYSVYGSLGSIQVKPGAKVTKGQVIGTVGVSDPDQPPHLHFEIRRAKGEAVEAVDPASWLRNAR